MIRNLASVEITQDNSFCYREQFKKPFCARDVFFCPRHYEVIRGASASTMTEDAWVLLKQNKVTCDTLCVPSQLTDAFDGFTHVTSFSNFQNFLPRFRTSIPNFVLCRASPLDTGDWKWTPKEEGSREHGRQRRSVSNRGGGSKWHTVCVSECDTLRSAYLEVFTSVIDSMGSRMTSSGESSRMQTRRDNRHQPQCGHATPAMIRATSIGRRSLQDPSSLFSTAGGRDNGDIRVGRWIRYDGT